jgi:hypothetical protein
VPLSLDTSPEIERRQIEGWRRMSSDQKAATVTALTSTAIALAVAGIRHRHPDEGPDAHRIRLAVVLHGRERARQIFPDLERLP